MVHQVIESWNRKRVTIMQILEAVPDRYSSIELNSKCILFVLKRICPRFSLPFQKVSRWCES